MYQFKDVFEFQEKYPTKEEKEEALATLDDDEIQHLIDTCDSIYGKIFYSKHLKNKE